MATRAIAADGERVASNETYVSSNLAFPVRVFLPDVNDGNDGTVAVDADIRIETLAEGPIEVLTAKGRRVGFVPPRSQAMAVARAGDAQSEPDSWSFALRESSPSTFTAISASPTQAEVTALRDCLVSHGLMKAE